MDFWPHETIASYWYFFETQQSQNNIMAFFRNVKGLAFHPTGIHPIKYKLIFFNVLFVFVEQDP